MMDDSELRSFRAALASPGGADNKIAIGLIDELLVAREQLTHFTKECWDCKEMQVCEPFEESDYDGGWMVWYCLDTVACKARTEAAKTKRAAERKAKRVARAAKKAGA